MIPFHIARPQNCDIQVFTAPSTASGSNSTITWTKPVGVNHIYMLLIGAGGGSTNNLQGGAGGSGAVTTWYGAAQHVPDSLRIVVGLGAPNTAGGASIIRARFSGTTNVALLTANGGAKASNTTGGAGGTAFTGTVFANSGFWQSVAGQAGANQGAAQTASTTTFLSGGAGGTGGTNNAGNDTTANYGYVAKGGAASVGTTADGTHGGDGYFQMQPILVGVGGAGGGGAGSISGNSLGGGNGDIGCGAGGNGTGVAGLSFIPSGGNGLILIASW